MEEGCQMGENVQPNVQLSIIIKIQLLEITCFKLGTDGMGKN